VAILTPSNKELLIQVASINYFSLYEPDRALVQVKSCIHYDPDDKQCKGLFRFIKRIEKEIKKATDAQSQQRFATALNALVGAKTFLGEIDEKFDELETSLNTKLYKRLHLKIYSLACSIAAEGKDVSRAEKWCAATLELDPDNADALYNRGEMKLNENDFEGAVRDLEKAFEVSGQQDNRIRQTLQRAQQLLRQSKKRDYYKILGNNYISKCLNFSTNLYIY
jgi:DnaJ family protein C protein 3